MKKLLALLGGTIAYILVFTLLCGGPAGAYASYDERSISSWENGEPVSEILPGTVSTITTATTNEFLVYGGIKDPVHTHNLKNHLKDKTTVSYVYYGSYPQKEIKNKKIIRKINKLANSTGKRDVIVDGQKYRRLKRTEATNLASWGTEKYHYFLWEPIKWRVLSFEDDDTMLLMADIGLDCKPFSVSVRSNVTWKNSTIRSWLNNYSSKQNSEGVNFSGDGFLRTAFSKNEIKYIVTSKLETLGCVKYKTSGCPATYDKVFLLSYEEVVDKKYGFCPSDEGRPNVRQMSVSSYSYMMGTHLEGRRKSTRNRRTADWWLRSPGAGFGPANTVDDDGYIKYTGEWSKNNSRTVVPAIRVKYTNLIPLEK